MTMTRPDIAYVVQTLSQFVHAPKKSHLYVVLRVVQYITGNPCQGLMILVSSILDSMFVYCDNDWPTCAVTCRSVFECCIKLGYSVISWKVKKQDIVSISSVKEEYQSMCLYVSDVIWVKGFLDSYILKFTFPLHYTVTIKQ